MTGECPDIGLNHFCLEQSDAADPSISDTWGWVMLMITYDLVKPISIQEINELRHDLFLFKSRSWSGRITDERFFANAFIYEAIESLRNSLELFEKGYFDCAFYCLRSSIELSTTVSYLHDTPEEKRRDSYVEWVTKAKFPLRSKMMESLSKQGMYFSDMKDKMNHVFGKDELIDKTNNDLNKHVHKQGYDEFYVVRNNLLFSSDYDVRDLINEFVRLFKDAVRITALMRLVIDPYPVLLLDPEINFRCPELEEPYDEHFVSKYLSVNDIECYKKTRIYKESYDSLIEREKCSEEIVDIKRYWIYDRSKESTIREQYHLLDSQEMWLAEFIFSFPKILKITHGSGMLLAHTEVSIPNWDNGGFFKFCRNGEINVPYKGRYISSFSCLMDGQASKLYLDHKEPFDEDEISRIREFLQSPSDLRV